MVKYRNKKLQSSYNAEYPLLLAIMNFTEVSLYEDFMFTCKLLIKRIQNYSLFSISWN